jgi:hypothetical protein
MFGVVISDDAKLAYEAMLADVRRCKAFDGSYSVRGIAQIVGVEVAPIVAGELEGRGYLTRIGSERFRFNPTPVLSSQLDLFGSL